MERRHAVAQANQTAAFDSCSAHTVVAHLDAQGIVTDARADGRPVGMSVLGDIRERLCDKK